MSKITDVVSWVMKEDKILKLQKTGQTYDIADAVANYLETKNLYDELEDKEVEVEIDEAQGQDGTIIRLNIVETPTKNEAKAEEPKESKPNVTEGKDLLVKELTVGGVSVVKAGVIFKEEENVWYTLDSTINAQAFKDECTKETVEVTISPQEKGNDIIKSYILKVEEKKKDGKEPTENTYKKPYNSDMQMSIEAQASMNSANRVAQAMVTPDTKPEFVEKLITRIAEHNFKTIQDLKNKE